MSFSAPRYFTHNIIKSVFLSTIAANIAYYSIRPIRYFLLLLLLLVFVDSSPRYLDRTSKKFGSSDH